MNPSDPAFERTYQAARGYFELGMLVDAWNELEELQPELRALADVILLRVMIYIDMEKWESAAAIGEGALRHYPDNGALYLATSRAVKHSRGPADARALLLAGEPLLRDEAIFHAMLAALDCQLGNMDDAKAELRAAFKLDRNVRLKALDDPDLAPLWDSLGS